MTQLIYDGKKHPNGISPSFRGWGLTGNRHEGNFWDDGNVLTLMRGERALELAGR